MTASTELQVTISLVFWRPQGWRPETPDDWMAVLGRALQNDMMGAVELAAERAGPDISSVAGQAACAGSARPLRWLAARAPISTEASTTAICNACSRGDLETADWAIDTFGADWTYLEYPSWHIAKTCEGGYPEAVRWLAKHGYPLTSNQDRERALHASLSKANRRDNDFAAALALIQAFNYTAAEVRSHENRFLRYACIAQNFNLVVWLMNAYGLGLEDARAKHGYILHNLCRTAPLQSVISAIGVFGLTGEDIRANGNRILQTACERGNIVLAQWLTARFGLGPEDVRAGRCAAVRLACREGYLNLVTWLVVEFGLGVADIRRVRDEALIGAVAGCHIDTVRWLTYRFYGGAVQRRCEDAIHLPNETVRVTHVRDGIAA